MSRLESFIRRMTAQRVVLDAVSAEVSGMEGPILELGLGNGRTFDHLRERLPGRRIIAFDRALGAHPSSVPPEGDLVIGEIRETAARYAGIGAALVHADIGTGIEELDLKTLQWLPGLSASLLRPRGIAVSGLPLDHPDLAPLPLPEGVPAGRYFIYGKIG
ncbi:class I SAM-dependent methyltransferase [Mesorhizobium sp. LHD-90]|uniref:class I SAM-dependent methyltransferase n=1 Tax=Mesorhizobium sp. LHD-90 TaxID=3071414 RepID=UPI0027E1AFF3|nr:class I SAM-dependent methyltransferase [Mesorhizobium sp. LHD-90]MDQ6435802.1 class I SAM-dependent methyltransferase [Mesorhizobium sp. LHD-90]